MNWTPERLLSFFDAVKGLDVSMAMCDKCNTALICHEDLSCTCPKCGQFFPAPKGDPELKARLQAESNKRRGIE